VGEAGVPALARTLAVDAMTPPQEPPATPSATLAGHRRSSISEKAHPSRPASNARSLVAGVNALFRSVEARRPPEARIVDDPHAHRFVEHDARVLLIRAARFVVPGLHRLARELQTAHCIRHRAIDVLLAEHLAEGSSQVVLIGAGYDSRARRLGALCPHVRWFELDHPATQARKMTRLRSDPGAMARVAHVPIDLLREDVAAALAGAGFDPHAPTCFVLEGIVHYLSPARIAAILTDIAWGDAPRSVILSYIHSDMYARADSAFVRVVQALREVPRWHTTPSALAALGARHGFDHCETWDNAAQIDRFAPNARGRAVGLSQHVALLWRSVSARE
jgi:methyltransferase (TIGR00027 family)